MQLHHTVTAELTSHPLYRFLLNRKLHEVECQFVWVQSHLNKKAQLTQREARDSLGI